MIYLGILLFFYGTYQLLCYVFMLPTTKSGRCIANINRSMRITFLDAASLVVTKKLFNKSEFEFNESPKLEQILQENGIFARGLHFVISKIISYLVGILIIFPLVFANLKLFIFTLFIWTVYRSVNVLTLFGFRTNVNSVVQILEKYSCQLLQGAFFISEIILTIRLFT